MFKTHFLVLILVFPFTSSQAPSFAASAKLSETQAIVFGGITSKGASNSLFLVEANSIQEIDFKTSNDIWTPLPTFKHCCAILDGILHCFGGVDSLAYVYRFDTATLSWISPLSSFLTPRIGHSCSIDNTGFHVYGGRYSNNVEATVY